jgi:hypothetical protein
MEILIFILIGIIGGILGGMGMGGGTLLIPLLSALTDIDQKTAQLINLLAFIPMAVAALIIHFKNNLVEKKALPKIILPALLTSALGAYLITLTNNKNLRLYFGIFLIALGSLYFIKFVVGKIRARRE